ncbi:RING-H2 finger protein ATL52-like [Bidens hawaiensis]|uniref:RING-H2 finger protein ATL52-like n=1 Tax=Bidens hawaiensis TaxID=980011 RepID=UPI00404B203D
MAGDNNGFLTEVYIMLLIIACGALLIALYHCVSMLFWDLRHRGRQQGPIERQLQENDVSNENSMVGLIPSHKHKKVTDSEDGEPMCAVCLSEFEEGDELRTLPECMHSFHVPCIDMWLYSHRSCPICRVEATIVAPSSVEVICVVGPQPQQEEEVTRPQYSDVTQDVVVQSRVV